METWGVTDMKNRIKGLATVAFVMAAVLLPGACLAVDAQTLKEMLDHGEKVTVIDIRSQELYRAGHIRDAIHIPAGIIARKPLPPIGRVVVCGDGIRNDITQKAVEALNAKAGIEAEMLEGGFSAWNARNFPKFQRPGIRKEQCRYITYQEFQKARATNRNLVLVDVRRLQEKQRKIEQDKSIPGAEDFSDLSEKFPGLEVIRLDRKGLVGGHNGENVSIAAFSKEQKAVYVIIDSGDGTAEKMAHRLYGAGIRQVVVLVGGERTLRREGMPGSRTEAARESL